MKKIALIVCVCILACLTAGYFYLYQGHRDISSEKVSFQLSSADLIDHFNDDPNSSNTKYLNQTIEVKGRVTEVKDSSLLLEPGIFCEFDEKTDAKWNGKEIVVKGRCIGFDELFGEVKLDQCTVK